jgi:hypothetical protein
MYKELCLKAQKDAQPYHIREALNACFVPPFHTLPTEHLDYLQIYDQIRGPSRVLSFAIAGKPAFPENFDVPKVPLRFDSYCR